MEGNDVYLLQTELTKLGFNILYEEMNKRFPEESVFGISTENAVKELQEKYGLEANGIVDSKTVKIINTALKDQSCSADLSFVVSGKVNKADGDPISGVTVIAIDQRLRDQKILGQTRTDQEGFYEIHYSIDKLARMERGAADLIIQVKNQADVIISSSPSILFNAPKVATVNIVVSLTTQGIPSEFELLIKRVKPFLEEVTIEGVGNPSAIDKLADLKKDDIDFLVGKTGENRQKIEILVSSSILQKNSASENLEVAAEIFYGLARQGLSLDLSSLLTESPKNLQNALEQSITNNIIASSLQSSLDDILIQLQKLIVQIGLKVPTPNGNSINDLLGTVASLSQKSTLLSLSASHVGTPEDFWNQVRQSSDFQQPGIVEKIQFALQLNLLTQNHLPLVQELQKIANISSIRDLVKKDNSFWLDLFNKQVNGKPIDIPPNVPGTTQQEKTTNYVNNIISLLQSAFPTDAVSRIADNASNLPAQKQVSIFFANSPDFDIRTSHVDSYAQENAPTAFSGISEEDKPQVIEQVKRLQRTYQISTDPQTMAVLLDRGLDSAYRIANMPRQSFISQHADALGGTKQAMMIIERSQHLYGRNLLFYTQINDAMYSTKPQALSGNDAANLKEILIKRFPNYTGLFGSLDLCDCKDCRSVLSPAAYLVDLFEFLRNSKPNSSNKTPLDVLFTRRPDLQYLLLSCENTNITLPYVDLVNEILESYVALGFKLDDSTSHDTGNATAQELDANPQFTNDAAYQTLDDEDVVYPFTLPFNQPVFAARAYLENLGSSRFEIIKAFQKQQSTSVTRGINAEYLGTTEEEYRIITGSNFDSNVAVPAKQLYEFYGFTLANVTAIQPDPWNKLLVNVLEFLRRTGITYQDLVDIVKTNFFNPSYPKGDDLKIFLQIPFSFTTLAILVSNNFLNPSQQVLDSLQKANLDLQDLINWSNRNYKNLTKLIVLDAPDSTCDLEKTQLLHLDSSPLTDVELSKIHRFIRLWRKLGWSIADFDQALTALQVNDISTDVVDQLGQIKQLQNDLNVSDLQILLSFWSTINALGDNSLFKKLFLTKTGQVDSAFEPNADGSILTSAGEKISDHIPAILSALRISEQDLAFIRTDAGLDTGTEVLSIDNVSKLYRYAALAKMLKLRISDLIVLKLLSGVNPFTSPDKAIQFEIIVNKFKQSDFKVAQLNYIYRHITSPPANLSPQQTTLLLLAKNLRAGLTKISLDNVLLPDPFGDITRSKMAILFDNDSVDATILMINGTAVYAEPLANIPDMIALKDTKTHQVIGIDPSKMPALVANKIYYDPKSALLSFQGAMTTDEKNALLGVSNDAAYQTSVNNLGKQPITFIQNTLSGFLDVNDASTNLVLNIPSLDQNLKPILLDKSSNQTTDPVNATTTSIANKFEYLLAKFLPYLTNQLSHSLAKQMIADALKIDASMAQLLLETICESQESPPNHAISDILALENPGLSGIYFTSSDLTGVSKPRIDPTISFDGNAASEMNIPAGTKSVRWSGMLLAPNNGDYVFSVFADGQVQLWVSDDTTPLSLTLDPLSNELVSKPITLKAGQFYNLLLEVTQIGQPVPPNASVVKMYWKSATLPKEIIPADNFYPRTQFLTFSATFTLLQKTALLINTFKLTSKEIQYFSTHPSDFSNFDLNSFPLQRDDSNASSIDNKSVGLFGTWIRINDFVTLRNSLPKGELSLIDMFGTASLDDAINLLSQVSGWDLQIVSSLVGVDGFNLASADLKNEIWPVQLNNCISLIKRLGVSAQQLFTWADLSSDFDHLYKITQDIKQAVHAKYDEQTWLDVAKSLNDKLRDKQRSALIDYLLPRMDNINDSNQLFEYFLIDVDMGACMETSRVKQAISSVQLFIQRCLLNLEENTDALDMSVISSDIDEDQWQWMKRYRIWEANRKVFLYPENWIEPGLRDNKSPIFQELESTLIKNDVTTDTVDQAFLNYLEKLDQVARLEICGMYWEDNDPTTGDDIKIVHVFGRTLQKPHIYYYRKLLPPGEWTSWEKMDVDIQGDHLIPVVWNRRLLVFWPTFARKSDPADATSINPQSSSVEVDKPQSYWEIGLSWSEYKQNKWSPKQVSKQVLKAQYKNFFEDLEPSKFTNNQYYFITSITNDQNGLPSRLLIHCMHPEFPIFYHPTGMAVIEQGIHVISQGVQGNSTKDLVGTFDAGSNVNDELNIYYPFLSVVSGQNHIMPYGANDDAMMFTQTAYPYLSGLKMLGENENDFTTFLNKSPSQYRILYPHQFSEYLLQAPFFYQDDQRTYFVSPTESQSDYWQLVKPELIDLKIYVDSISFGTQPVASTRLAQPVASTRLAQPVASTRSVQLITTARTSETISASNVGVNVSQERSWITYRNTNTYNWYYDSRMITVSTTDLLFDTHYHPFVSNLVKSLAGQGISALLATTNQMLDNPDVFKLTYDPTTNVESYDSNTNTDLYPKEDIDFRYKGAYSNYNWELFFHAPLIMATRLSTNRKFEDAMRWFHYIFNPMSDGKDPADPTQIESSPARYWPFLPFKTTPQQNIQDLMMALDAEDPDLVAQVDDWRHHPFQPHRIARLRISAYKKYVFMKYLDNLIAWGDQLFRQDTIESINEAEQLYIMAANLLGPSPQTLPDRGIVAYTNYFNLQGKLDKFSNVLVQLENEFPFTSGVSSDPNSESGGLLGLGKTFYFCIPNNNNLLGYWQTVADRLYKIRNCMNIMGMVRQLALFEPPIDPALLVQAAAQGIDLGSVLNDVSSPLPIYRFSYMLQKALEICAECRSLGSAMLSALEKKDAEEISLLRATHETNILTMMKDVKTNQQKEAYQQIEVLNGSRATAEVRYSYYQKLLGVASPTIPSIGASIALLDLPQQPVQNAGADPTDGTIPGALLINEEKMELDSLHSARDWQVSSSNMEILASLLAMLPNLEIAAKPFGAGIGLHWGSQQLWSGLTATSRFMQIMSSLDNYDATHASKMASYFRRWQEWTLQNNLAASEIMQIDKQLTAANIRAAIADQELQVHLQNMNDAQEVQDYLTNKYTNKDLYDWMISEISSTYFQCYQLAYDIAKKAERAYRFELGLTDSNFIQFGYWDSLRSGLQAGERLYMALKQLEQAYHDQNNRQYEITKNISLVINDPMALIRLKETGKCVVELPESLFDADYPGHYMRRIKNASLTIPCVVGPYTSINCTLTLLANKIRIDGNAQTDYSEQENDSRFVTNFAPIQSIATSHAQNDSGMFELNLRDERFLTFEGAGAISRWRIEMPKENNAFDFNTISDVIIKLNYTARDGGDLLRQKAQASITTMTEENLVRMFSVKNEFPNDWYKFLNPSDPIATSQILQLDLSQEHFPFLLRGKKITINKIGLFLNFKEDHYFTDYQKEGNSLTLSLTESGNPIATPSLPSNTTLNNMPSTIIQDLSIDIPDSIRIQVDDTVLPNSIKSAGPPVRLNRDAIEDLFFVVWYAASDI